MENWPLGWPFLQFIPYLWSSGAFFMLYRVLSTSTSKTSDVVIQDVHVFYINCINRYEVKARAKVLNSISALTEVFY